MNIYLVRHGDAEKGSLGKKDFDRELTSQGKAKLKIAVEGWKNLIPKFDVVVSSPLLRAKQTAEIISEAFGVSKEILKDKALAPGGSTESICEIANSLAEEEIVFIGHQPDLGEHVSNLISGEGAFIEFKKGAIAKISFEGKVRLSRGTLEYLIPAGIFPSGINPGK